ncbi:MAG: polyphosphate kinase 2 [Hyphomicrobiales bacterium]
MNDSRPARPVAPDFPEFDLDAPLPESIDKAALRSGGYPYDKRMKTKKYEKKLHRLQIELLKMQDWARARGERVVIVFEGRDAAGKGGTIKRFMQHLNPRHARAVALSKPTEAEQGQWYFQRYVPHLPTAGDIVMFDRSWYNRAGVERVMGFCAPEQVEKFYDEVPVFEGALARDGIHFFKLWLTIGREMQLKRLHARRKDPLKRWKLTDIDMAAIHLWEDYSRARDDMFRHTHREETPWTVVRANDKRRTRIAAISYVLSKLDYTGKDADAVGTPDPDIIDSSNEFLASA